MQTLTRIGRAAFLSLAVIALAACAGQKEPAQKLIADIEATVTAASAEAAKVRSRSAHRTCKPNSRDSKPPSTSRTTPRWSRARPRCSAPRDRWPLPRPPRRTRCSRRSTINGRVLAGSVPGYATAIQERIDFLSKKSNKKLAAGIDLDAAKAGASEANSLWSKAQAAFATGNMDEAVSTAKDVKARIEAVGRGAEARSVSLRRAVLAGPASQSEGAFADDDRGAGDMRGDQGALVDLQAHPDLPGPLHLIALPADESGRFLVELTQVPQVGAEHRVRIAADRVLGNAQRRAKHARFGPNLVGISIDREHEESVGLQFIAERSQSLEIRRQIFEMTVIRHRHQQPAAALVRDSRRHDFVQLRCRQLQRLGNAQRGLEGQRRLQLRRALAKFNESLGSRGPLFDRAR